ncbi:MAG: alpha/beta hydrolase, partial [Williamsia herbipolensis]|nr:alpha/beta hydrolase [Williamsia herbipolensis]
VRAVVDATSGAADTTLFGLSSGAVIALEAARTLPGIRRLAVYEPPFYRDGIDRTAVARLHADLDRGALGAALVDSLLAAGTAPTAVRRLPRPVARTLARGVIAVDDVVRRRRQTFRRLLPGVRYDFHDVAQVDGRLDTFAAIDVPVLLLRGTASPAFLRDAVDRLQAVLPDSAVVDLDGLGHDGPWNGGGPEHVARTLLDRGW